MECLALILQAALLIGYTRSNYLFFIDKVITSVLIGFASFGLPFYLIISPATLLYNFPFQTLLFIIPCFLIYFDNGHRKYLRSGK